MRKEEFIRPLSLAGVAVCLVAVGCARVLRHDPDRAVAAASEFATVAFVNRDLEAAYVMLHPDAQRAVSRDQFVSAIRQIHPKGYPAQVAPNAYEPAPGQAAMNVFLTGAGDGEEFYYRLYMMGTAPDGYRVGGFFRGNGPPPNSPMRRTLGKGHAPKIPTSGQLQ